MTDHIPARGRRRARTAAATDPASETATATPGPAARTGQQHDLRLPTGPRVLPREVITAHQRDRILNAMLERIALDGYEAATVARVAKYAGMSSGTFYQLFTNREDAFAQLYDRTLAVLLDDAVAVWDQHGDGPGLLRRCLSRLLETAAAYPDLTRVAIVEAIALGSALFDRRRRQLDRLTSRIGAAISEHHATPVSPLTARAIVAAAYDLIEEHAAAGTTAQLPKLLDDLYEVSLVLFEQPPVATPPAAVSAATLARYQKSLDRVYTASRKLIADAPTWQAALYASLQACYTEMRSHPEALRLHFIETAWDEQVEAIRTTHRTRLLTLLHELRDDAPAKQDATEVLRRIHAIIREQLLNNQEPPELDDAEQTFATVLFHHQESPATKRR